MKIFRKKYLTTIAGITLVLITIGCESKKSREERKLKEQVRFAQFQEQLLKPGENKTILLALKYKIEPERVEDIVTSYLSVHEPMYRLLKQAFQGSGEESDSMISSNDETIIQTINKLSKRHNIPPDILASIIVDYQMWSASGD